MATLHSGNIKQFFRIGIYKVPKKAVNYQILMVNIFNKNQFFWKTIILYQQKTQKNMIFQENVKKHHIK